MRVYLCGPINGCTDEECKDWREAVKAQFPDAIDPMVRDYRGRETEAYREIVDLDKSDIQGSDALLVNYSKPSVGTSMEVFYAHSLRLPVIVWCPKDVSISPWLRYHSTAFVHSLEDAVQMLKTISAEKAPAQRLLGWIYHRSRFALFSNKRAERDKALSEINHATQSFGGKWMGEAAFRDPNSDWTCEKP